MHRGEGGFCVGHVACAAHHCNGTCHAVRRAVRRAVCRVLCAGCRAMPWHVCRVLQRVPCHVGCSVLWPGSMLGAVSHAVPCRCGVCGSGWYRFHVRCRAICRAVTHSLARARALVHTRMHAPPHTCTCACACTRTRGGMATISHYIHLQPRKHHACAHAVGLKFLDVDLFSRTCSRVMCALPLPGA